MYDRKAAIDCFIDLAQTLIKDKDSKEDIQRYIDLIPDEYDADMIIREYTREGFMYKLLNNTLRVSPKIT
jgi:hypothetical protein